MCLCATEHWNWDTWTGEEREDDCEEEYDGEEYNATEPHCDDEDFIVSLALLAHRLDVLILLSLDFLSESHFF